MTSGPHLSDEQLARFQDGELPDREAGHLKSCQSCAARLQDLERAAAAYVQYRDSIREPLLPPPPERWLQLDALIARNAEAARHRLSTRRPSPRPKILRWWPIPALAGVLYIAAVLYTPRPSTRVNALLTQSAQTTLPEGRFLTMRRHGRTLIRPAVLTINTAESDPDLEHLRTIFTAANYSWREPLSARSFLAWRSGLKEKRDSVSVIGSEGGKQSYRVRTDSPAGALRSASLTLRAEDLRPTNGAFEFEGEGALELAETPVPIGPAPQQQPPIGKGPLVEAPAGPEDTLHVLAALNGIGADVGVPIDISEDPGHRNVVVRAAGLDPQQQQQITQALKPLPRVLLDFDSRGAGAIPAQPAAPEKYSASIPGPLRQQFEERLGGAVGLQEVTDRVLEASASALARVHAVQVLAGKFPSEIAARLAPQDQELLRTLQQRHVSELARLAARIRMELRPLLTPSNQSLTPQATNTTMGSPWQNSVGALVASAQETDTLLNRLLAGSYSQPSGEEMLRGLDSQIERLESAIQSQQSRVR